MKIWQFIWERLRGPFVSGNGHIEYPRTFHEELNDQCSKINFYAALIATFALLPYISIDRQLYPDEPIIVALRIGLSLVGFTVLVLQNFRRFQRYNLLFLILIAAYLEIAVGLITGLAKADPAYLGGYLLTLTLLALVPIPRRTAWSILAVSVLAFFAVSLAKGVQFDSPRSRYSLNDLAVTIVIVACFIYLLDRLRFNSWVKSKEIHQRNVALRQSEARYRIVFEQAAVGVAEIEHHTGRFLTANRRLCELLERTEEEMRNTTFLDITHPEDLHLHEDKSRQLLEGTIDHYTLEKRYLSKSGAAIWVNITVSNPRDTGGAQGRNIVIVEDISERKLAEEALRQSEEKLQLIVDTIPQIVSIWDMNLRCNYISPMIQPMLGYTPQEAMALNMDQLITPDSMKVALEAYEEDLRQEQVSDFSGHQVRVLELDTYHKDGSVIPLEVTVTFLRDAEGVPTGIVMLSTDITERKRAEEALRESEGRLRTIIEGTQALLLSVNAEGQLTYVNEATAQALGYPSAAEITGRLYLDFVHPDDRGRVFKSIMRQVHAGQPSGTHEFRIVDTQGRIRWYSFVSTLITRAGQFAGMTGVAQNITERKQAEEALRQSEEKYRLLTENIDDVIWTVDTDWRITYVSPSIRKLRGLDPEEGLQQAAVESMTPSSLEALLNEFSRVRDEIEQGGNPTVRLEVEQYRKDGSTIWVEAAIKPMRDDTGRLTGFVGVSRDISVRRKIEASLQASEEKFRQIVSSIPNIVSILDMNLRFTYVSNSVQRILGYTPEECMSLSIEQIFTPESLAIALKLFQERLEANAQGSDPNYIHILELEQYHKNGSTMLIENTMTFLRDANGVPVAILSVSADITERRKAETALRESEQRLADIIDFLPLATMVIDRQGRVTAWNRAMEKITEVQAGDIVGKGNHEYSLPFYGERRPTLIDLVFASQKELAMLYSHIHQDGGVLSAEAYIPKRSITLIGYASALYDSEGNIIGAIESVQDITNIRRVEAELKEAKDAADAANRSKSVFLANMSHEIRTPMNAILGFAQLMERGAELSPQAREHLSIINRSGEHLLALINDILEMSKIEAGRSTFSPDTFDLQTLLEDIERMFSVRTEAKRLQFLMEKVGDIPRWVVTDEGKLRQVLINLLGNAVKFTEEGGIVLRLSAARAAGQETVNLRFEVEDTGPGMAEEEMGRLFQAFEQTRAGVKSGGTGLGLALSRGFIHVMGGSISVASTIGQGTTFRVEVPVREGREEQARPKEPKRRILRLRPGQGEIRVLIADDLETNRQLLLQLLEPVGFTTHPVADGQEAVQAVRTWKPWVVLMDMTMPVMDGYEATQIIKASPELKDTVIIAVTASAFEEDRQRIIAAGADGYLPKPFKDRDLFETIGRLTGAEYLYEEEGVPEKPSPVADGTVEMRHIIHTLPEALVRQMRDAVEGADLDRLNALFGPLAAEHASLVQGLQSLAARYDYEALIALFSQERNP